jgi:hypothetical protein
MDQPNQPVRAADNPPSAAPQSEPAPSAAPVASRPSAPSEHLEKIKKTARQVLGRLSRNEQIMSAGAILALASFFLPWVGYSSAGLMGQVTGASLTGARLGGLAYLVPLLAAVSLVMVYFSIGAAPKTKAVRCSYQLAIGTALAVSALMLRGVVDQLAGSWLKTISFYGSNMLKGGIGYGLGWWLLLLGSSAIIYGAVMEQKANLK